MIRSNPELKPAQQHRKMKIEHIAIWVNNIDEMIDFYTHFFNGIAGNRYHNVLKGFESCFVSFEKGPRIELMKQKDVVSDQMPVHTGYAHISFQLGSRSEVDTFIRNLLKNNVPVVDGPRVTGDGYYEAVILDPEKNRIEICG